MSEHNYEEPLPVLEEGMVYCPEEGEEVNEDDLRACEYCGHKGCTRCMLETDYGWFCDDYNAHSECFEKYMIESEK